MKDTFYVSKLQILGIKMLKSIESLRTTKTAIASVVMTAKMALAMNANTSSHREAIDTMNDPCIDNTVLYAWVEPSTHDKHYLVAGLVPLHQPGKR